MGVALIGALALAGSSAAPVAVERPDFTGVWRMDTTLSEFGNIPGGRPRSRVDRIVHRDPGIVQTLHLDNGGRMDTTVYRYTTDGKQTVNRVDGRDITSTVGWEGSVLRLESKTRLLLLEMSLSERWKLSPDGRTLTMARRVKYVFGDGEQTLVFRKQPDETRPR